jgi:diguanylate cyclase (GGDEF)-like protein
LRQQRLKPSNEANRLIAVRSLNSAQKGATMEMEALTTLACGVFDTAFAAVHIIEEDWQRSAGHAGPVLGECGREQSVCTRVVYANDVIVVPDIRLDPELSMMPYVVGDPHFCFYAGAPVALDPGLAVGAFCILDTRPRQFSATQIETLRHFATVASALLRLQKSNIVMAMAEQDLRTAAMTDPLTGFFNRSALPAFIDRALAEALQAGRRFGALYIDLDDFKAINDRLGHHAGDDILRQGAERIRAVIRGTDIVVRMGGDEFAIFAPERCDRKSVVALAERLVAAFREPFVLEGKVVNVRVSVGAALAPEAGSDRQTLLKNVDDALYRAKSAGRDQFVLHRK